MKITEILALAKLGYSKSEIDELRAAEAAPEQSVAAAEVPDPEQPAAEPATNGGTAELLTAIQQLTTAIHAGNIQNSAQPAAADAAATVESVLNDIINPK